MVIFRTEDAANRFDVPSQSAYVVSFSMYPVLHEHLNPPSKFTH